MGRSVECGYFRRGDGRRAERHHQVSRILQIMSVIMQKLHHVTIFARAWNKGTQTWLAFYVMKRLPEKLSPQQKKIIVMCTSALWHGLYPGELQSTLSSSSQTTSHVTRHKSYVTSHTLHVTLYLYQVTAFTGYYCTFLLASFWSEAEKKLFAAVAPVSKVQSRLASTSAEFTR